MQPDITTLGKVIGGGMPVGAFGGKRKIMEYIAPLGPVYQAGTLSGNPIAMTAGLKTLELVSQPGFFTQLERKTEQLATGLQERAKKNNIPLTVNQVGGMFGIFFSAAREICYFQQVMECDMARFKDFFHGMLKQGIYLAPSAFEAGFISSAHSADDIETTLEAAGAVFARM